MQLRRLLVREASGEGCAARVRRRRGKMRCPAPCARHTRRATPHPCEVALLLSIRVDSPSSLYRRNGDYTCLWAVLRSLHRSHPTYRRETLRSDRAPPENLADLGYLGADPKGFRYLLCAHWTRLLTSVAFLFATACLFIAIYAHRRLFYSKIMRFSASISESGETASDGFTRRRKKGKGGRNDAGRGGRAGVRRVFTPDEEGELASGVLRASSGDGRASGVLPASSERTTASDMFTSSQRLRDDDVGVGRTQGFCARIDNAENTP